MIFEQWVSLGGNHTSHEIYVRSEKIVDGPDESIFFCFENTLTNWLYSLSVSLT